MSKEIEQMKLHGKLKEHKCKNGEILYSVEWIDTDHPSMILEQKINGKWYFLSINMCLQITDRLTQ